MMKHTTIRRRTKPAEEGYILVAVIFMLAILMISLSIAAPAIKKDIQRDRELETMQRGKQYARAIKMYYKKFGAYPPNVDALVKTSNIRFLRRKYIDLTTGKDEWKPVRLGQNKAPTAMGFFGQPLSGSTLAGTGPSGGNGVTGATNLVSSTDLTSTSSTTPPSTTGITTDPTSGSTTSTSTSSTGQTFGGAGIIGFSPNSPKQSILVYKKKNHYNEWEFTYDPLSDKTVISSSSGPAGQSATSTTSPTSGTSTSTSPTSTTTTPQQ